MPIRMVAIDLDGTLLNDAKQVEQRTLEAIRRTIASGVKVVIASARPPRSVRPFFQHLGLDTLQINYNGALIWDEAGKKVIHHEPMTPELVRSIVAEARGRFPEVLVSLEVLDRWLTDRVDPKYLTETARVFGPDRIAPIETFLVEPITKLMLLGEPKMILELERELILSFAGKATVVRCDPDLLQVMHPLASKAAAVKIVAQRYGISLSEVLAIGDAPNDVEMLQCAGYSVAVGNAHPSAKSAAKWIAPDNNAEGVLMALQHHGLAG